MEKFNPEEGEVKVESFSSVCDDDERRRRGERESRAAAAAAPSPSGNVTVPLPPAAAAAAAAASSENEEGLPLPRRRRRQSGKSRRHTLGFDLFESAVNAGRSSQIAAVERDNICQGFIFM